MRLERKRERERRARGTQKLSPDTIITNNHQKGQMHLSKGNN